MSGCHREYQLMTMTMKGVMAMNVMTSMKMNEKVFTMFMMILMKMNVKVFTLLQNVHLVGLV